MVEEAGAEKANYALKLLQSEGELTIASTGEDPQTGKMVTQEYHVEGPVMIFLTTTAIDLDEELQNRCLTLAVDETPEQTRRIHRVQRERRTLAGLLAHEQRKDLLKTLRNAQRLLARLGVIKDFFRWLTKQNVILHNPASELELPRMEKRLPTAALTLNQVETLLAVPNVADPLGIRDRAMLELFYICGLRRA